MKNRKQARSHIAKAIAFACVAGTAGLYTPSIFAATAAGTQIKNLATVSYQDAAGNTYTAQSNEAIVTVAQVYSASLGVDIDTTAASGQTVYLPFVLTNTGNGEDVFDLTASNNISIADILDSPNITIYQDSNGNGEPDAGEQSVSSVTLAANAIANLVVAVEVPATATESQTLGVTLKAEAHEGSGAAKVDSVTDLSADGGRDKKAGTNEALITVTGDAVLVTTKSAVHDPAGKKITYTVTVKNNGSRAARNVIIYDGLPAGTTLFSSDVSGLLTTNGDLLDTVAVLDETVVLKDLNADGDTTDNDEATLGIDLNTDGDTNDTAVNGVYAVDASLPPQSTVSMTFTVTYDPALLGGGYIVENIAHVSGDVNEDGIADTLMSSNTSQTIIEPTFGVTVSDLGGTGSPLVNDGADDDESANFDQFVDEISAGGTVLFPTIVTNDGNAVDIFELSVAPGNFPLGTVFTFFDATGAVQLADTNGSGVDTGVIAAGASKTILIKAILPADASGDAPGTATEYEATITAVSANDVATSPVSASSKLSLGTITVASVDLHTDANGTLTNDEDPLGVAPYAAAATFEADAGGTVTIPLYIDNESGSPDSYVFSVGSQWNGTALSALPAGWTVQFFEADASGAATGAPITSTAVIPANSLNIDYVAVVSVPSNVNQAVDNFIFDNNGDGISDVLSSNDSDGDYPLFFQITSQSTGATDIVLNAVDVSASRSLSLVTPGANQIEPGGTVTYSHTLSNAGNVGEVVELTSTNSQADWTSTISIDTNGDGDPDTVLGNLTVGTITVQQADGTDVTVEVTDVDNDGKMELLVSPGFSLPLTVSVFAPSTAPAGQTDVFTLSAANIDVSAGAPSASLNNLSTVIIGQVRLVKTVAVDADCNGIAETGFDEIQALGVAPGQCAIWRVVAQNQGSVDASNVIISDTVPAFSTYEPESLTYCKSTSCLPEPVDDDPSNADAGSFVAGTITFYVGDGASPADGLGGVLVAGEQATAQFSVRVE